MIQPTAGPGTVCAMSRFVLPPSGDGFHVFGWLFGGLAAIALFTPIRWVSAVLFLAACVFWAAGGIINALASVVVELRDRRESGELP
jgi:hypothetical protein